MRVRFSYDDALAVAKHYLPEDKAVEFATMIKAGSGQIASAIEVGGKELTERIVDAAFRIERDDKPLRVKR